MLTLISHRLLSPIALLGMLLLTTAPAQASLATDLETLNTQASALNEHLLVTTVASDTTCGRLLDANRMARDLVNNITQIDESLAAPLQVDAATLDALDQLSHTTLAVANETLRLSVDLNAVSGTVQAFTLKDGIVAMLQLSDDIGTMADRIGEMADKILVMSDNIGLMADRILITQELQNQNIALTTQSILQTQTNALAVVAVVEDSSYNLNFTNLITNGELLTARMMAVAFSPGTMDDELARIATDVQNFLAEVQTIHDIVSLDTAASTMYISADALKQLFDMSIMLTGLATAIDGYVIAIGGLQTVTADPTLASSLQSMLQLSADIGLMANRILEMADQILIMADNIGLQADQILATQEAMNLNVATTQSSILAAQTFTVNLIALRGL